MTKRILPTPEQLRELLTYDPETGKLFWKPCARMTNSWNGKYPGKEAFTADSGNGYRRGAIMQKNLYAHRVIWALHHGAWPEQEIDHINLNRSDNRIRNLREASRSENCRNTPRHFDGSSRFKGVSWNSGRGKWMAQIWIEGGRKYLGLYHSEEEAKQAYERAADGRFGEYHRA